MHIAPALSMPPNHSRTPLMQVQQLQQEEGGQGAAAAEEATAVEEEGEEEEEPVPGLAPVRHLSL